MNGMDTTDWDPAVDKYLDVRYDAITVEQGKALAKEALQAELGLEVRCPLHSPQPLTFNGSMHACMHAATEEVLCQRKLHGACNDTGKMQALQALPLLIIPESGACNDSGGCACYKLRPLPHPGGPFGANIWVHWAAGGAERRRHPAGRNAPHRQAGRRAGTLPAFWPLMVQAHMSSAAPVGHAAWQGYNADAIDDRLQPQHPACQGAW